MSSARIENHIPGGIENAAILGHCHISDDKKYALVSVLPENIQLDLSCSDSEELVNSYCLFIDEAAPQEIRCELRIEGWIAAEESGQPVNQFIVEEELIEQRVFHLRYSHLASSVMQAIDSITVNWQLFHNDSLRASLEIIHTISVYDSTVFDSMNKPLPTFKDFHLFFIAFEGNPKVTGFIKGNLLTYFRTLIAYLESIPSTNILPLNISLAVVYIHLLRFSNDLFFSEKVNTDVFTDDCNNGYSPISKLPEFGICGLKAHFVAQFFDCDDPLTERVHDDFSYVSQTNDESAVINEFLSRSPVEKIKFFNLIRFPKSAIKICHFLLDRIIERHREIQQPPFNQIWNDITEDMLNVNDYFIKTLISEMELGVHQNLNDEQHTSRAEGVFNMAWSPYIQDIVRIIHRRIEVSFSYGTLRIKVIDVRSGKPLENKRVKRIRIIHQAASIQDPVVLNFNQSQDPRYYPYRLNLDSGRRYGTTRDALRSFGYPVQQTQNETAQFNDVDRNSITRYLRDRGVTEIEVEDISEETNYAVFENIMTYIIQDFENCLETDELGTLNIMIPKGYMDGKKVAIQLGFYEFPIIEESDRLLRPNTMVSPTNFEIKWLLNSEQNQIDDWEQEIDWTQIDTPVLGPSSWHFGWGIQASGSTELTCLKTCLSKVIKNDYDFFEAFINGPHFNSIEYPFHLTIFGMEWCQPIWDGIKDPNTNARSNDRTFINRISIKNVKMHIVTREIGRTNNPYGHYYGFWNSSSNPHRIDRDGNSRPHRGIDLYSGDNGDILCFAIKGGRASRYDSTKLGHRVDIRFTENDVPLYRYCHLRNGSGTTKSIVMAGEKIGECGRSGSTVISTTPSHLHIELRKTNSDFYSGDIKPNNIEDIGYDDKNNNKVLPSNKLPMMLPCQCSYGDNNPSVINCTFSDRNIIRTCWAVQEFPYTDEIMERSSNNNLQSRQDDVVDRCGVIYYVCPYILDEKAHRESALQAKLRFLHFNKTRGSIPDENFFDPGFVDGALGAPPTKVSVNGLTQGKQLTLSTGTNQQHDGLMIKVQYQQETGGTTVGWIESSLLDDENKLKINSLESFVSGNISKSRMAIYMFKRIQERLDYLEYEKNFSIDKDDEKILDNIANYLMPE